MMKMSSLTISICPRWKIAVMADVEAVDPARQQSRRGDPAGSRCCASSWSTSGRSASFSVSRRCLSVSADALGAEQDIVDPALHVLRPRRLRREFGKLAVAGERDMHLGDAPPGLRHVAQIGDLLLAFAGMLARRQQALLVDKAVEIGSMSRSRRRPGWRRRQWTIPIALRLSPSTSSTLPSSAGVLAKPATSVRKRPISISGLMPVSSLR